MRANRKDTQQLLTWRPRLSLLAKTGLAASMCVAFGLGVPLSAQAVGIGEITLESSLNAPLEGLLVVSLDPGEVVHEGELLIKLASSLDHQNAGIPYPMMLRSMEITEERQIGRTIQYRISSQLPINEPIISLLLELEWDKGKLKKEVTLLVDPVDYSAYPSISPENENLLKPGDYISTTPPPAIPAQPVRNAQPIFVKTTTPAASTRAARDNRAPRQKIVITDGVYGPVRPGDSLSRIAVVAARNTGVDVDTMMELIYDANPEAFGGSQDLLVTGSKLQIPGIMPDLRDIQTLPDAFVAPNPQSYRPPPVVQKPLLTIVGSEDEAARVMPEENRLPSDSLTQTGQGSSVDPSRLESGNADIEKALQKIEDLELANQTLVNDKQALENNLASTQEQLGNVRNELDRLVVELRALSQMQSQPTQATPTLAQQIERWLPWLLLFLTLPIALALGLRSRPRESSVYAPPAAAPSPYPAPVPAARAEAENNVRANPTTAATFDNGDAEDYLPEYEEQPQDETITNEELLTVQADRQQNLSREESDLDDDDHHQRIHDPLAETLPGIDAAWDLKQWDNDVSHAFEDDEDTLGTDSYDEEESSERRLQSLPSEGDTQEVIRSTLHKLDATQLISPGETPMEPETALDAVQEAEIYIAYDQFSLAEKTIDKLLTQDPDNDHYLLLQLKLFAETGSMDELQDLSVRLLHKHPDPDSEINERIRRMCDKAFTQTNLKRVDFTQHMEGKLAAENPDNETILEDMTAETLFVDGVKDFLDDDTLLEEDELRAGVTVNDTLESYSDSFDETLERFDEEALGSLTTEIPPHVLEERDRTEIFDDSRSSLLEEDNEETLSEGLELPFDLESEIARYESELEDDLGKKRQP